MHPAVGTPPLPGPGANLHILGRLESASNATYLAEAVLDGQPPRRCVWKPVAGERPLWDFPDGTLAGREVAAYALSAAAGFAVVPCTVLVDTGDGGGALQTWVDVDDDLDDLVDLVPTGEVPAGWFPITEGLSAGGEEVTLAHADDPRLRRLAVFDALANNSDRKGVHLLPSRGAVLGCDHGLCFHVEPKLRTILWGWAGTALTPEEAELIARAARVAPRVLADLVTDDEIAALTDRAGRLVAEGRLPYPGEDWPAIPWPPL